MSKLWQKDYTLDPLVETFMTGDDPYLDAALIPYDCLGSLAHMHMLAKIGIINGEEEQQLKQVLLTCMKELTIKPEDEDVHTALENKLVAQLGVLGKKIHTARSRNDQVLVDLRLYGRDKCLEIVEATLNLCETLYTFANSYQAVPMPGRTHFQRAMPSSVGLWAAAFLESLLDNMRLMQTAYEIWNQCPLGSAASYGVPLPLDRQFVSDLLGFQKVQNNVLYANNSRGKLESILLSVCVQNAQDLSKLATDLILFSTPEFGYFHLPEQFCPGSSLMPNKRNPCPLELIRAKASTVQGCYTQILDITRSLPSGYNRDFQETKRPFMQGLDVMLAMIQVMDKIVQATEVDAQACIAAFTPELFATDEVLQHVLQGVPFRDAYRQVAAHLTQVTIQDPVQALVARNHAGGSGCLNLHLSQEQIDAQRVWLHEQCQKRDYAFARLLQSKD